MVSMCDLASMLLCLRCNPSIRLAGRRVKSCKSRAQPGAWQKEPLRLRPVLFEGEQSFRPVIPTWIFERLLLAFEERLSVSTHALARILL